MIRDRWRAAARLALHLPVLAWARDSWWLCRRHRDYYGTWPRLWRPTGYADKTLHSMIFDRNPIRVRAADKLACRELVAERVGPEHLVPLIGVYERPDQIPWDDLPPRFMAKTNHGSGWFHAVHDLSTESREELTELFEHWLSMDYYPFHREWVYRDLPARLMFEQLLVPSDGAPLVDFKPTLVDGEVCSYLLVVHDGDEPTKMRFTPDHRPDERAQEEYPHDEPWPLDPSTTQRLEHVARSCALGFDHVRVDMFVVDGQIYVGELTSYPAAALIPYRPLDGIDAIFAPWRPRKAGWRYILTRTTPRRSGVT